MGSLNAVLSRRAFLQSSAAAAALAIAPLRMGLAAETELPRDGEPSLSFAGPDLVQLEIADIRLAFGAVRAVEAADQTQAAPARNPRFGHMGTWNGQPGHFSGTKNTHVPQQFLPWPTVVPQSRHRAFEPTAFPSVPGGCVADLPENWRIISDGPEPLDVVDVFRKTLPVGIAITSAKARDLCKRHLVSLRVSRPVNAGEQVEVLPPGMASLSVRQSAATPSHALHWCHQGYARQGPKRVYLGLWLGHNRHGEAGSTDHGLTAGMPWQLVRTEDGSPVRTGALALTKPGDQPHSDALNYNGCDMYVADFSAVDVPGRFRLEVAGVGATQEFEIADDPYAPVLRAASRWYFHQRSGIEIAAPFGEGRTRPRNGHPDDGLVVSKTDIQLGRTSEGFRRRPRANATMAAQPTDGPKSPDAWGGWHDAGDWDRRIQHMDPICAMAEIIELFPACRTLSLNLPESGRPFGAPEVRARAFPADTGDGKTVLPDLIHEALWGLSLWRRTQTEAGGIIGGVEYSSDGIAGSVSWNPIQDAFAYREEEWSAYRFAEAAAKLGQVISNTCGDAVLGAQLIGEAARAWGWAEDQLRVQDGSLAEDETQAILRARVRAAACLYRATGDAAARQVFEDLNPFAPKAAVEGVRLRRSETVAASLEYVRAGDAGRTVDPDVSKSIRDWARYAALPGERMGQDYGLNTTDAYRWGIGWARFGPGSNWPARRMALMLAGGAKLTEELGDAVLEGLWFGLGCNPSNTSFVQGFGQRAFSQVTSADLEDLEYPEGLIVFGVAAGQLRKFEYDRISPALYPRSEESWPRYARIFECSSAIICAEHGMKSNAMEWLFANALAHQVLTDRMG